MKFSEKYPIVTKQNSVINRTAGNDNCMNTITALSIHGIIDKDKLEKSIQDVINKTDALRFVFYYENGNAYQSVLESMKFELNIQKVEGNSKEEKEKYILDYTRKFAGNIMYFDGSAMFDFILFELEEDEYVFVAIVNHVITDGVSNTILMTNIISSYNGIAISAAEGTYLEYINEEEEFIKSDKGKQQIDYWLNESKGFDESFLGKPTEERSKSAFKNFFDVDLRFMQEYALKNKVSTALLNIFLCQAAISAAYNVKDTGINVVDANRTKHYRNTVGFIATGMLQRFIFKSDETLTVAFGRFIDKYKSNIKNTRLGYYADSSVFAFTYLNYLTQNNAIRFGDAEAEPFIGIHEARVWDTIAFLVTETSEKIIYKLGCDDEIFTPDKQHKFRMAFEMALNCLVEKDIKFDELCSRVSVR